MVIKTILVTRVKTPKGTMENIFGRFDAVAQVRKGNIIVDQNFYKCYMDEATFFNESHKQEKIRKDN